MPGASLWLLPPEAHPLSAVLTALIQRTASHFGSSDLFIPHLTLTSDLPPSTYASEPQQWLDSLDLPTGAVHIEFAMLASEPVYFRKLYLKCVKTASLTALATACKKHVAGYADGEMASTWAHDTFNPHVSLLYHDCPQVDAQGLAATSTLAQEEGIDFVARRGLSWTGGRVVLVATDKPTSEWAPIAQRVV
ncbi:2',3'-cyclic-nucleotide 3'-phosphodiesterase [Boeremia exigua]|uniref:2',3'-cyclic-nucleotide 3'-phosphodiesterase n=1 Tax=Boeremia exigua TaxID=749465 RepID=UPI001E8D90B6|nr:2',3'-cyclic-nucleotide 3'-phosphodiesterase [Boeremia exigua]KAH6615138.1 2',3'-cyclic-nucleotide 3'-phosphodiesterase [Boeremia exigua]